MVQKPHALRLGRVTWLEAWEYPQSIAVKDLAGTGNKRPNSRELLKLTSLATGESQQCRRLWAIDIVVIFTPPTGVILVSDESWRQIRWERAALYLTVSPSRGLQPQREDSQSMCNWSSPCPILFCSHDSGTYLDGLMWNWPRNESVISNALVFIHCDEEPKMFSIAGVEYTMCKVSGKSSRMYDSSLKMSNSCLVCCSEGYIITCPKLNL